MRNRYQIIPGSKGKRLRGEKNNSLKKPSLFPLYAPLSRGFTLIEMLAVIAIFIVVGSVGMAILITSFRTSQKTDIITLIQQNGNYALSQMGKTIRDARGIVTPFPCVPTVSANAITIITPDNQQVTFACLSNGASPATIASNGVSLLDTTKVTLTSCSFSCSQESDSDLPIISINFSLQQQSSSKLVEQIASQSAVGFQTSIETRNINR